MRQVYRLLSLVRRHSLDAVDDACRRALDAEVIDVGLIERMLTRGVGEQLPLMPAGGVAVRVLQFRFRRAETVMSPARPDATPAVKPIEVCPDLKALMRRLKLGQLLDTLPERLALPARIDCRTTISWRCCWPTRSPAGTANSSAVGPGSGQVACQIAEARKARVD
jgi:hypothetical protein